MPAISLTFRAVYFTMCHCAVRLENGEIGLFLGATEFSHNDEEHIPFQIPRKSEKEKEGE
jgi:hypothetical protein